MHRRLFLASLLVAPTLQAQGRGPRRVLLIGAVTGDLEQRLRELGFASGRDVTIESPQWDGSAADLRRILRAALGTRVDVIVACGALPAHEATAATRTIPVVMAYGGDPVQMKMAASFARPGGNLTGLAWADSMSIGAKSVEIFKEALPRAKTFGVLGYAEDPGHRALASEAERAFAPLGMRSIDMLIRSKSELEPAFRRALKQRLDGVILLADHIVFDMIGACDQLARASKIPILWAASEGGRDFELLSFGPDTDDHERRAADYVAKILAGAKPGDLAIEQTNRTVLSVNLRTAKRLNLRIPEALLARADNVIE